MDYSTAKDARKRDFANTKSMAQGKKDTTSLLMH